MTEAIRLNVETDTVGIDGELKASLVPVQLDPPIPVAGMTFGVATMHKSAPHGGEMHPDGDEVLYLVAGRARLILENGVEEVVDMEQGDGVIVPQGVWHRVEILEPCTIVYLTPGPNNQFRPLEGAG